MLAASLGLGFFAIDRLGAVNEKAALIRDDYLSNLRYLGEVNSGAAQTGAAASQVLIASWELGQHAETLRAGVATFLATIKAA